MDSVYVVHVVIDDLGYNDIGFRDNQSISPFLNHLHEVGVRFPDFYVYKSCAPSRASVLTGRYPWRVGFYNNNGGENCGVPKNVDMLPALLKKQQAGQWATHALGKWHVGWLFANYTPTGRGFDTFFGTSGNSGDYFYHAADPQSPSRQCGLSFVSDWVDATAASGKVEPADSSINGTYAATLLTRRAQQIIARHDTRKSMYMYLAYHNVHHPNMAPLATVKLNGRISQDVRKVHQAMLTEVDYGLANISETLRDASMLARTLFIVHTDNGGPLPTAANNYPLRGGKFSFWEGGLRGLGFVSNPGGALIPAHRQGSALKGLVHISDFYNTIATGLAGVAPLEEAVAWVGNDVRGRSPPPADSVDLWPAILGQVAESPRTQVLHLPTATLYEDPSVCSPGEARQRHGCAPSVREGPWKLLLGEPGDDSLIELPPLASRELPYGRSGGLIRNGDQAICNRKLQANVSHQSSRCSPMTPCLFDVSQDPSETRNLASKRPDIVSRLKALLDEAAKSGQPLCDILDAVSFRAIKPRLCQVVRDTGYSLPVDWNGPIGADEVAGYALVV